MRASSARTATSAMRPAFWRTVVREKAVAAVTGYDGIPVTAASAFSLTTVRQDARLIAEVAVRALLARMHPGQDGRIPAEVAGEDRPLGGRLYRVVPELVVRDTTAPPRERRAEACA